MSREIDSRVVEMQFNNGQFEKDIGTTMNSLGKLKQSLNMEGASRGLSEVEYAARNIDLSSLSGAIETVKLKFSALEIVGITALVNIANTAVNTGKRVIKSLTIDPVSDGFKEYETVLNAVQTTMAGTGKTAEEVEVQLQRLDKYADDTIYSTDNMLSNLPKFTNAGVELEKATTAMIGIANATALAGGDAQSASSAFYNLGQSIGTGYLTRMDYNSINNAGIATMEWKNHMVDAAIAQGKLTKTGEDSYRAGKKTFTLQSLFIDGLQEQWATADVLMKVFEDYGDVTTEIGKKAQASAQDLKSYTMMMESLQAAAGTGWKDTWQILFGDLEEAKELWTGIGNAIGDVIGASAKARNEMLQDWKDLGGRDLLIEALTNAVKAFSSVFTPIKDAFREFFPATTGDMIFKITEAFGKFTKGLILSDENADKVKRTFSGLFSVLELLTKGVGIGLSAIGKLVDMFGGPLVDRLLTVTAGIGDFLVNITSSINELSIFNTIFDKVTDTISSVSKKISEAISRIKESFEGFGEIDTSSFSNFSDILFKGLSPVAGIFKVFGMAFDAIVDVLVLAAPIISKLGSIISTGLTSLLTSVNDALDNLDFKSVLDIINAGIFGGILVSIKKFVKGLNSSFDLGFLDNVKGILDGVRGSLEAYQSSIKAKTLLTIASAVGVLALALLMISTIDEAKMTSALTGITVLLVELSGAMIILGKTMGAGKMAKVTGTMMGLSIAILILSVAMTKMAKLDWDGVAKGTVGIAAMVAVLVVAVNQFSKVSGKMVKGSVGLIGLATAILILTSAVSKISELSWEELLKGLMGLTVILAEIVIMTRTMGDSKRMISTGIGMIAIATAMIIFSTAIKKMGQLSWDEIGKGLTTLAGTLTAVTLALRTMPKDVIGKATGLLILGAALNVIALAVRSMGQLSWEEIGKGITTMAGSLLAITAALNFMPKDMVKRGIGLIAIGAALLIISEAVKSMGSQSWEEVAKGITGLAGSLLAITTALNFMPKDMVKKGIGLTVVGGALVIISKAIKTMGSQSWEEVGKSMTTLGGALLILTAAMTAMTGGLAGAAAMVVMSTAIALLTPPLIILGKMSIGEIGAALLILAGAFTVFGVAGLVLAPMIPVMLGLAGAMTLLGIAMVAIGGGLLMFSTALTGLAVSGAVGAAALIDAVKSIIELIPLAIAKVGEGLILLAEVVVKGMPVIVEAIKLLVLGIIEIIIELTPKVVEALILLLDNLLEQLVDAIPKMIEAGMLLILGILEGVSAHIEDVVIVALEIITKFLEGIAKGIPGIVTAGVDIVVAFVDSVAKESVRLVDAGFQMVIDIINGVADSIRDNSELIGEAMGNLATAMIDGLVLGIKGGVKAVSTSALDLGKAVFGTVSSYLEINSPSKLFRREIGKNVALGMAQGIDENSSKAAKAAKKMADDAYSEAKMWISNYQNDTDYLITEEILMWDALGEKYTDISKEKIEIDKKIRTLTEKAMKEDYDHSKKWIDEKKQLNELSMTDEIRAWERVQSRYMEGTDLRKQADKEMYDARKRLFEEQERLMGKMEEAEGRYTEAVESRSQSIFSTFSLFDELQQKEEVSGRTLSENLRSQVEEMRNWASNLERLAKKGIDEGLLAELQNMGPSANSEISALTKMTDRELTEYQNLWKEKHEIARKQAVAELQGLRADTDLEVAGILSELSKLDEVSNPKTKKTEESGGNDPVIKSENSEGALVPDVAGMNEDALSEFEAWLPEYMKVGSDITLNVIEGINGPQELLLEHISNNSMNAIEQMAKYVSKFKVVGEDTVLGFVEGMRSKINEAAYTAAEIARAAYDAAKQELGINSPSKEFESLGKYSGQGLAIGISKYGYLAENETKSLSSSILKGLKKTLSSIPEELDGDINLTPVIRPVLDLSSVKTESSRINALLSTDSAIEIETDMDVIKSQNNQNGNNTGKDVDDRPTATFNQYNYSPKALSRLEIYRQTKNQFSAAKGALGI